MKPSPHRLTPHFLPCLVLGLVFAGPAAAQNITYPDPALHYVYPAGAQAGQTVAVELGGRSGLDGAREVLVEGLPGVTVRDVKAVSAREVRAVFQIAPDAPPGRRLVRLLGGSNGLSCFRYFHVGRLPEVLEKEPNGTPPTAQEVTLPAVVNGRLDPALDVDCFRFRASAGQRLVAAVLAHGQDSRLRSSAGHGGFLDTSLELLDGQGRVLAEAEDTLGLDPVIEHTVKADGQYTVRIQALGYAGSRTAVYRLTLGDVPYPVSVFPPGGRRGQKIEVELAGPNVAPGTRLPLTLPAGGPFPWHSLPLGHPETDGRELPFLLGDLPEGLEAEPNDGPAQAPALALPVTVNGRFDRPGDVDCYRVRLKKGQAVLLEVTAQRHLRSPVDTLLEVTDAAGKKVAENDDGLMFRGQCEHDFPSADSRLELTAPQDGDYFIRVSEQGGTGGPHAVYRLAVEPMKPDFRLYQWPDAVPIWGPGTTASLVVQVERWGGLAGDIRLRIEGLPAGWTGSVGNLPAARYVPPNGPSNQKALLTITAPADAPPGAVAPFRVVGTAEHDGRVIEHPAQPQTLYGSSHTDRMHLRHSTQARAVVAGFMDCSLETGVRELTVTAGGTVQIPVKVRRRPGAKGEIGISVDGETPAAGSGWRPPLTLRPGQDEVLLPLEVRERPPGTYGIVVSRSWSADLRAGRPGPCTPLILLHVLPARK